MDRSRISFSELLHFLPHGHRKSEPADRDLGVSTPDDRDDLFVSPTVSLERELDPIPQVILLVAPAAVGKSMLAKEIAASTNGVLFDLATVQVGTNSFAGSIINAFGYDVGPQVLSQLQQGNDLVVVDALDEAELAAGDQNFNAFVHELCRFGRGASGRPSLLLLARSATAEWIEIVFEEEAVPLGIYSINFFEKDQADDLINRYLDKAYTQASKAKIHRQNVVPFEQARELLYEKIYVLFESSPEHAWSDDDARRFLGYAPVLRALAEFLKVDQPHKLAQELGGPNSSLVTNQGQWRLLLDIVVQVLEREHGKFMDRVWPQLKSQTDENLKRVLYTPEEQCSRIFARASSNPASPPLPLSLTGKDRSTYDEAARNAVANHPFLEPNDTAFVNVVFRDYVYAHALAGRNLDSNTADIARRSMLSVGYLPSPMLANFLLSMARPGEEPSIAGLDIGFVIESLSSRLGNTEDLYSALIYSPSSNVAMCQFTIISRKEQTADTATTDIAVDAESGVIFIPGRASHIAIYTEGNVDIGGRGELTSLGPDVHIGCSNLSISGRDVRLHSVQGRGVELTARTFTGPHDQRISHWGSAADIEATWNGISYPWFDYRRTTIPGEPKSTEEVERQFRRIVARFKNKRGDKLYVHKEFLDFIVVKDNDVANKVLSALIVDGYIRQLASDYELDLTSISEAGVDYMSLRRNDSSPEMLKFLSGFVRRHDL